MYVEYTMNIIVFNICQLNTDNCVEDFEKTSIDET